MKCNFCKQQYTFESVRKKYGSIYFAEFGCCSEECFTNSMTGQTPPPDPEENTSTGN